MDDDRYLTGGGEIIPEQRSASYSTNTSIGPFSGGAILAGQEDATPIVGGRFTTQLPEGLSATLSRTGQAGAPMEYARDAIRLAKQLEAGQLALEASRVGSQGLPSYGLQYSGQIGREGGAPSYYPQPKGHWFVEAGGTPQTPERHVRGGARFNFADGGTVEDALHAVRQHFDEGGFLDAIRNYFTSDGDYQSTGDKVVSDGKVNWGDPELAADFFRADKARMALDKRPAVGRPEDDVTGSVPMPRPRPAPEAPAVKIPFEAPKAGFELPEQAKPEGATVFPYTGFRAVPPNFAMPSPVAPDLPAPRAAPDVRPMAYAPAAGGAQSPALQAISTATSPLDIRDISHLAQYRGAAMENPQAVVFHHTAGEGTPEGVINTLNTRTDPFTGRPMVLGTHYIIDRDGGIHAALPPGTRGAHILPSKINDLSNANTYGVEVIAKDNSDVTPAQIAAGQRLYAHLSAGRSEPLGVFGHGELNPGHKLPDEGLAIVNPIRMAASPTSATDAAVDTARKVTNRAVNYPELSAEDRDLIAKTIAAEASGKSPEEAHAIANVILNRAISGGRFGKSIQDILFAKNQFEPWSDESKENYPMKFKPGMKAYDAAAEALQKAYDAGDITGGSTYFWAPRAQGRLGRDVPDFAKYPGFNIGATRFHRETREAGGEVDAALRVVREHHADGERVGRDDPRQWLQFGGQDMERAPAGLPIGQAVGTSAAYHTVEGLEDAAKLANQVRAGEVDPLSDEGIQRALNAAMVAQTGGLGGAPARAGETVLGSGFVRPASSRVVSQAGEHGFFQPQSARERDPRLWHPISNTVLSRPLGEMTAEHQLTAGIPERKFIRPEDLEGASLIPALGDRTMGGGLLRGVNDISFKNPVEMQAGHSFMYGPAATGPDRAIWASDPGVITILSNKAKAASEAGFDPYLSYVAMGSRSGDYSHHMTDALREMFAKAKVKKDVVDEFDRQMRENTANKWAAYADWPGLKSKNLEEYLYSTGPGKARTKMAELMGQGQFQKAGMPEVGAARFAITDPELLHAADYSAGRTIARLDPMGRKITEPAVPHKTYKHQLAAHPEEGYVGGFEYDIPFEVMNKEFIDSVIAKDAAKAANPSQLAYTYRMNMPRVDFTPQVVDRLSKFLEMKKMGLIP